MRPAHVIGMTVGSLLLAVGPALAVPASQSGAISWTTADAVAAKQVAGSILSTTLGHDGSRSVYDVRIRSGDKIENVKVAAHTALEW